MTKISRMELWILSLTLLFVVGTMGWFFSQNRARELVRIEVSRDETSAALPAEDQNPAPGLLEGERIDLNTAPAGDLERLPGIGPAKARDIVAHREAEGPFPRTEAVMEVPGIGEKTYEKIAAYITVSEGGAVHGADSGGG